MKLRNLIWGLFLVQAFSSPVIAATTAPAFVKFKPDQLLTRYLIDGTETSCLRAKSGKMSSGRARGKKFFLASIETQRAIQKLNVRIHSLPKSKTKKLKAKVKKLKDDLSAKNSACGARGGIDVLSARTEAMTRADVSYLYEKAALGAVDQSAYDIGIGQGVSALVDHMMTYTPDANLESVAAKWLDGNFDVDTPNVDPSGIMVWSLYLMINTPNPYYERLAFLFLHNLLSTSMDVLDALQYRLGLEHLTLIRAHARSGDYPELVRQIAHDGNMLLWLSGDGNKPPQPNENFARELMELFTLGPTNLNGAPNYSETTVAEVARACTGWIVRPITNAWDSPWMPDQKPENFDTGAKHIFEGTKCEIDPSSHSDVIYTDIDVINRIFSCHPSSAYFLARRLAKEYLSDEPPIEVIMALANVLKSSDFNINVALKKLFKSKIFYAAQYRNSIIKNPIEKAVEFLRRTKIPFNMVMLGDDLPKAGMIVGRPPDVFGWKNSQWPSSGWLINFVNLITKIIRDDYYPGGALNQANPPWAYSNLLPNANATDAQVIDSLSDLLGVSLSPDQIERIKVYMNRTMFSGGQTVPAAWDATDTVKVRKKVAGVLEILSRTIDFQMR